MSNFKFQISNKNKNSIGFTLIELMVVFSVMVILSTIGFASFVTYSRSQSVSTNMLEYKTTLFTARSRALSQLRDSACFSNGFTGQGYQLKGYQVVACCNFVPLCAQQQCNNSLNDYELQAVYDYPDGSGTTTQTCKGVKFSNNTTDNGNKISFTNDSTTTTTYFFFSAITGAVTTGAASGRLPQITLRGYGITKVATVSATGVIQ